MFRAICICGVLLSASLAARGDIHNLTASASGSAHLNATVSIQDPNQVQDGDQFELNGPGSDDALAVIDVDGQFTGEATASASLSTTPNSATFNWAGTAAVALDEDLNSGSISAQSNGHLDIDFDVVGSSAGYVISFSTASASFITVSLSGGGDGFDFCHNAFDPNACNPPNFPLSGTLPPGSYHIVANVRDTAGETTFFQSSSPTSYTAGFSLSLTLNSTPAFSWVNSAGGDFVDGNNWNPNVTPTSNSVAVVDLGGTFPINITGGSADQLLVRNTTLDLFGGSLQLSSASLSDPSLSIGGQAEVVLHSGSIACANAIVGDVPGTSLSVLELLGTSSQTPALGATGRVVVGDVQNGRLNLVDASLTCANLQLVGLNGTTAAAQFSGPRTLAAIDLFEAGTIGASDTQILDGGVLAVDEVRLGGLFGISRLAIDGVNASSSQSTLTADVMTVGTRGNGTIEISNGGKAILGRLTMGSSDPASLALLTMVGQSPATPPTTPGSFLQVNGLTEFVAHDMLVTFTDKAKVDFNGDVTIRTIGSASFSISGAETVCSVAGTLTVAGQTGAVSTVEVGVTDGAEFSQATGSAGRLVVGDVGATPGPSSLIIIDHPVSGFGNLVHSRMEFANIDILSGTVLVKGAGELAAQNITVHDRLEVNSNLLSSAILFPNVKCDQLDIKANGIVRCCPQGQIAAQVIVNEVGATLEGDTHVTGSVVTSGLLRPGCSPGTMTIDGDFEQTETGVLQIEIAGREAGQFDVLKVTGKATLAGTLLVKFIDEFAPNDGDALKTLDFGGAVSGQFSDVRVEGLPDGQTLNVDPVSGQIAVATLAAPGFPPNVCGAGACGAGIAPLWIAGCGFWLLRPFIRRGRIR